MVALATVLTVMANGAFAAALPRWQRSPHVSSVPAIRWMTCAGTTTCIFAGVSNTQTEFEGSWLAAAPIRNLPTGATVTVVDCPKAVSCVVGGSVGGQAFLLDEIDGVWGTPTLVSGTAPYEVGSGSPYEAYTSSITAISCTELLSCTAAGNFTIQVEPSSITFSGPGFVATLTNGTWSAADFLNGVDAITSIACPTSSSCVVAGYTSSFTIFISYPIVTNTAVVDAEVTGHWQSAVTIAGLTNLAGRSGWIDSEATEVTCTSAGACTVGGNDENAPDFDGNPVSLYNATWHGFVVKDVGGTWGSATESSTLTGVTHLACGSASHCVATDGTRVTVESNGHWGVARTFVVDHHTLAVGAIACATGGSCLMAGTVSGGAEASFASAGTWSSLSVLPHMATVSVASCPASRSCVIAGGSKVTFGS